MYIVVEPVRTQGVLMHLKLNVVFCVGHGFVRGGAQEGSYLCHDHDYEQGFARAT